MVFNAIAVWLLIGAIPLWAYRWLIYSRLEPREKQIFRRIVLHRHERAVYFALRMFGYLVALAIAVMAVVFGLRYLKHGNLEVGAYRDMIRSRYYSGVGPFDEALNTFHYDQMLPVALLTTCALLSIAFTLVASALRDISTIRKLTRKLASRKDRQGAL